MRSLELILPAHNEEQAIGKTVSEFLAVADRHALDIEILVAEDGSTDRTREVVTELAERSHGRIRLTPPAGRKGYSGAVVDAFRLARREIVICCDADGQFDPDDLPRLLEATLAGTVVAGARSPRRDTRLRRAMSWSFGLVYRLLIGLRMKDPSSPFVVAFRSDVLGFLPPMPVLRQGFWWEFFARADAAGLRIVELPVAHRVRTEGATQVYRLRRIPRIALAHLIGLAKLRAELRRASAESTRPSATATVER